MNIFLIDSVEEGYKKIKEYENETFSKFYVRTVRSKDFGNAELYSKNGNSLILWFNTLPYIFINQLIFDCKHGPDRHVSFKKELERKNEEKSKKDHIQETKTKKIIQCSRKLGCPAKISLKEIFSFPDYTISTNNRYNRIKASKELRALIQKKEVRAVKKFILTLPANEKEHAMHPVGEAAEIHQSMDEKVKLKIKELVAESITDTVEIKRHLQQYVTKQLFPETIGFPSKSDRRFYPSSEDIRNIVKRTLQKLSYSTDEQENIQHLIDEHLVKYPNDFFYFRPYHESDNTEDQTTKTMLIVYQSAEQKYLLQRYGNGLCLLDATYRTTKYALPLFFICVKTNVNYQVVAIFITQNETTASIIEAINILKEENPKWNPKHFMTDFCEQEINAIETIFPETFVFLCDFHREQAWERWVKKSSNGVHQAQRDDVLKHLREVANAESIETFHKAVETLKSSNFWKTNSKMQSWFEKEWLSVHKRWVWVFRKDEMELPINTNNGVERQNRRLKYDYLSNKIRMPLHSMLNLIITKFIPDSYRSYKELNIRYSSGYRKYSAKIPDYLINRPRPFIFHCIERMSLAQTIQPCDVIRLNSSNSTICFKVCSQTDKNSFYQVDFGNDDVMPSCECYDFQRRKWLCKHFFAVFAYTNITWENLSSKFKDSPYLTLDMSIKGVYVSTHSKQEHTEINTALTYPKEFKEAYSPTGKTNIIKAIETDSNVSDDKFEINEITDVEPVQQATSLAVEGAKVREMLTEIRTMSYEINDTAVMENLSAMLEPVLKYVSTKTVKEKGLTIAQNKEVKSTNKRKRNKKDDKNTENIKNIALPLRKKRPAKKDNKFFSPTSYHECDSANDVIIEGTFDIPCDGGDENIVVCNKSESLLEYVPIHKNVQINSAKSLRDK